MYTRNCEIKNGIEFPESMQRLALCIEYSGTPFNGFQRQASSAKTVQQYLESALSQVADEELSLVCAGRTDAGVHATAQVIHFDTLAKRPNKAWVRGVNALLPDQIRVVWAQEVSKYFHSRFSALSRQYRYVLYSRATRPAILDTQVTWVRNKLDLERMQHAANYLIGEHDFSSFRASKCQASNAIRVISEAKIYSAGQFVVFEVKANGFLYHMVRNIVGTLLEISEGKKSPEWVGELMVLKDRRLAAATADPDGLYLSAVEYSHEFGLPSIQSGPFFL